MLNKILEIRSNNGLKRKHYEQVGFIPRTQGWFKTGKLINVNHHINSLNKKKHMIISIDAEKAADNIHSWFFKKIL